jgi:hypothetical protein
MPRARFVRFRRLASLGAAAALAASALLTAGPLAAAAAPPAPAAGCVLGPNGAIRHVVYVQFDNTHFLRDRANVPSDLEQMPHLLNFIRDNGVLMSNDHTALISYPTVFVIS